MLVAKVKSPETPDQQESDAKLSEFFMKLAGSDVEIDAWELQKILTYALKKGE